MAASRKLTLAPAEFYDPKQAIPKFKSTKRRHDEPLTEPHYFYVETEGEPHDHSPDGQALLVLAEKTGTPINDRRIHHVGAVNEAEAREVVELIEKQTAASAWQFGEPVKLIPWKITVVRAAQSDGSVQPYES